MAIVSSPSLQLQAAFAGALRQSLDAAVVHKAAAVIDHLVDARSQALLRDLEADLAGSLNVSAAARELYMHRNTMMYRLDKIKRTTGLVVRSFDEAVAFRILYKVYRRNNRK